ncbi:endonuclease V [candidate division WOR-3 bacterium]|nr:endonuclease V [candidate division WOR-3 bacterium]
MNFAKLKEIQERLRKGVIIGEFDGKIELVAGMDCAFEGEMIFGAVTVMRFSELEKKSDILLIDGQGTLHPRNFGIACHLGVILGKASIGCAKKRLCGEFCDPGIEKGDRSPVFLKGIIQGYSLRTKNRVKPLFVSPGNLFTPDQACEVVLKMAKFRLPEPLRHADRFSKECKNILAGNKDYPENTTR